PFRSAAAARVALGGKRLDFRADALPLWGCQRSEATTARHSRVERVARMLLPGQASNPPSRRYTEASHAREMDLLDQDRRSKTRNRGRAGSDRCHRATFASAGRRGFLTNVPQP